MNNELKVSGIVLSGIISALVLIPLFGADTTIFLTTENGGTPVSCAPQNGLVLAQNITDLCDVTIINATSGQIIEYNGTQWVNVNATTFSDTTVCNNLGSGTIICAGGNVNLKSLIEGSGIDITSNGTTITIASTISGESTECENFDNPNPRGYSCIEGTNILLRGVAGSLGISVTNSTDTILITNTLPENTVCTNAGSSSSLSEGICINNSVSLKRLLEGTAITLSSNSTHITITNTGVTSLSSDDTASLSFSSSTGSITASPKLKKLCEIVASGGETTLTCTLSDSSVKNIFISSLATTSDASTTFRMRFNADSGNNYNTRSSSNGGADGTSASDNGFTIYPTGSANLKMFFNIRCIEPNVSLEKLCYGERLTNTDGNNAPSRLEMAIKWKNTANLITSITMERTAGTGTLSQYSMIEVWGYN